MQLERGKLCAHYFTLFPITKCTVCFVHSDDVTAIVCLGEHIVDYIIEMTTTGNFQFGMCPGAHCPECVGRRLLLVASLPISSPLEAATESINYCMTCREQYSSAAYPIYYSKRSKFALDASGFSSLICRIVLFLVIN